MDQILILVADIKSLKHLCNSSIWNFFNTVRLVDLRNAQILWCSCERVAAVKGFLPQVSHAAARCLHETTICVQCEVKDRNTQTQSCQETLTRQHISPLSLSSPLSGLEHLVSPAQKAPDNCLIQYSQQKSGGKIC